MRLQAPFASLLPLVLLAISNPVSAETPSSWSSASKTNLTRCREEIRHYNGTGHFQPHLVWRPGDQSNDPTKAIGTDYATCKEFCGTGPSAFDWERFSSHFTGWLLPFLALTAQYPYESDGTWHNLVSIFLTIASPQLATYSLVLTILNSRYAKRRLDSLFSQYPHSKRQLLLKELKEQIFQTLRVSQQQPFELGDLRAYPPNRDEVEKTNDELQWWTAVQETLTRSKRLFTASLTAQSTWVIISFSFTWVNAFGPKEVRLSNSLRIQKPV
jgi:hypothetical protein